MIEALGPLASLAEVIFRYVTEPNGYHEWSTNKKLGRLHESSLKALNARDFAALDALLAEYKRLRDEIV
jgi:hypothetical protein